VAAREIKSVATRRFWKLFRALPAEIQKLAVKNYQLRRRESNHRSLHFRLPEGGRLHSGTATWVWIGTHSEYDQLIRSL
jgi:hypothetical protein